MWKLKIGEGGPWMMTSNNHLGRQHWEFDPNAGTPEERDQVEHVREEFKKNRFRQKQSADLLMRMHLRKENDCEPIPPQVKVKESEKITEHAVTTTLRRALSFFSSIQAHDGHWPSECAGGLFFLPPLVIVLYITGSLNAVFGPEHRKELIRYIYNHQNEDGGWGKHIEGPSTMIGSAENYIALRLLGEGPEDGEERAVARGRKWILDHGGALGIPSWGKFWLTVLGVYEWSGCNPLPPELWLLPRSFCIHPGKMVALARLIYLPMSFLYGKRFIGPITELVQSLRQELYNEPYHEISWNKARYTVTKEDLFYPHPLVQDMIWGFLYHVAEPILTRWPFSMLREKALKVAMEHVHYEDVVSKYLSVASQEKGIGSQTWEASLAVQAIISCGLREEYGPTLRKAHEFLKASQIRENHPGKFTQMYRHICKGGWTFNIADQGWITSDCSAEALKAVLLLSQISPTLVGEKMDPEQFYDGVNVLLSYQSTDGSISGWEPQRTYRWLEYLNPTEFLADTIVEREYGRWGICYTYATWFGVEALIACERSYNNSPVLRKACEFLLSKQLPDGGWGESYLSGQNEVYTNLDGNRSSVFHTALASLALIAAGQAKIDQIPIQRGIRLLINSQMEDGDFPQQEINGIYMKNGGLNFSSYRNIFTIWALGEYRRRVLFA